MRSIFGLPYFPRFVRLPVPGPQPVLFFGVYTQVEIVLHMRRDSLGLIHNIFSSPFCILRGFMTCYRHGPFTNFNAPFLGASLALVPT